MGADDRPAAKAFHSTLASLCLALALALAGAVPAYATGIVVNDLGDATGTCATTGTGTCTLRDAMTFASSNAGPDSITFGVSGTIKLGSTLPVVDDPLTIDGAGRSVTISGNNSVQVMLLNGGSPLTLNALTIADGFTGGPGAGIYNPSGGSLTVTNSTFTGNFCGGVGAAITMGGTLSITNSTFFNNGFIFAIWAQPGTVTITNSTIDGNVGGFALAGGTATITNSIVAGNGGSNCGVFLGTLTDGGHNIEDGTTCGFQGATCPTTTGSSFCNTDPRLDPADLQDNGGSTQTLAVCTAAGTPTGCNAASPAINAGNQAVCGESPVNDLDQRGFVRPGRGSANCTIGAFEANGEPPGPAEKLPAPAMSAWGLTAMAILLVVSGTLVLVRRTHS